MHPDVEYLQELLGDPSKWRLIDPSNIVNTRTDGDGYTDFLTNATSGTFYLTRPLDDFMGGPIAAANEAFSVYSQASMVGSSGTVTGDRVLLGTSDNADPTAGGAKFDTAGVYWWTSASDIKMAVKNESTQSVSGNGAADRSLYVSPNLYGETENAAYVYGYNGTSGPQVLVRSQASLPRAYVPTHLVVIIISNSAAIKTIRAGAGFHVHESLKALEISPVVTTDNRGRVWFYPDDAGTLEEVDLKSCWSSLDPLPMVGRRTSRTHSGRRANVILGGNFQVRAVLEMFNDDDVLTGLFAAQNQLYRGRTIGLCANASKAWAGYAAQPPQRGDTSIRILGQGNTFQGSGSLSVGDLVVIQTVDEDPITELVKVTGVQSNRRFSVSAGVKHTFPRDVPILVRHRYYWPALWLDQSQINSEILTTDHGLNYTFDALLTEDLGVLQDLVSLGGSGLMTGVSPSPGRRTFTTSAKRLGSFSRFRPK